MIALVLGMCGCFIPPQQKEIRIENSSSLVALVRDGDRTVMTMANDFQGDVKEFAVVVPVPTFLEKEQIHVGDPGVFEPLDRFTAPKLVEPLDDPCNPRVAALGRADGAPGAKEQSGGGGGLGGDAKPVTVEARYTVGEYDITILSAKESDALEEWLKSNGYKLPKGAGPVLQSYIKQKMRFFVAKVNLESKAKTGYEYLRPLQIAYESPKFMLPIRLGMVNSDGPQELTVYLLTKKGRVETTNYRVTKLPTGTQVPIFVKNEPGAFYQAMFRQSVKRENMQTVFLEYAGWTQPQPMMRGGWNGGGGGTVNPVAPPSEDELKKAGVFWLRDAPRVHLTRLHLRYDEEHFPEDLVFQETDDSMPFQASFSLLPNWSETATCLDARTRRQTYGPGEDQAAQQLARLTGWDVNDIRSKMKSGKGSIDSPGDKPAGDKWYQKIWDD